MSDNLDKKSVLRLEKKRIASSIRSQRSADRIRKADEIASWRTKANRRTEHMIQLETEY